MTTGSALMKECKDEVIETIIMADSASPNKENLDFDIKTPCFT
jgi:hypothetical protein